MSSPQDDLTEKVEEVVVAAAAAAVCSAPEQTVTPWTVDAGLDEHGQPLAINYKHLIQKFGTQSIDNALLARFKKVTGHEPHRLMRRGIAFSHRDLDAILTLHEQGKPFFLYTGRGPSSVNMHLGHFAPFLLCKWLQDVFNVPLVVQLTDDEKFLFRSEVKLDDSRAYARANAREILACGFNPDLTFLFADYDYISGSFYRNISRVSSLITHSTAKAVFGFCDSDNIGRWHFPSIEIAPCAATSFPHIFGDEYGIKNDTAKKIRCLIPCAIDQDPYFRLARDLASRVGYEKPALLHTQFMPALEGLRTKMSASSNAPAIYPLKDTPDSVKTKVNKYAFSGGRDSAAEHRQYGGNPDVDISFQYLRYLLEDDAELDRIEKAYRAGTMLSGELKKICIDQINLLSKTLKKNAANITDEDVAKAFDFSRPMAYGITHGFIKPSEEKLKK